MKIEERNGSRFLYCDYTNGTTIAKVDVFVDLEKLGFSFQEPQVTMRETSFYGEVEPGFLEKNILEFASKWSRILFNAELGRKKIRVGSECGNSHRIRVATSIHKLHCKKFF
ncbi:Uncharacterized protein XB16_0260 [Leptospira santarosai]|uniref:Uncharacterized protein n=1 Tax=Leptospira santarosai TaxID=28183 RepID=A0A2P1QPD6_9LEPT|nr:Uncharacterized protein XB16_0260 [Leptospira santarosai]